MKKKTLTLITAFICLCLYSTFFVGCQKRNQMQSPYDDGKVNLVNIDSAKKIAQLFNPTIYYNANNPNNHSAFRSTLNGNNLIKDYSIINDKEGIPALYIFNYLNNQGFIFVSADYQQQPILAFIEKGTFRKDTVPVGLIMWANKTVNNIELIRLGLYDNSKAASAAWKRIYGENSNSITSKTSPGNDNNPPPTDPCSDPNYYSSTNEVVGPLLPVTWGQLCTYNESCPNNGCNDCSSNAATGCVATSVSQIINYWQPTNSFSYNYTSMPSAVGNSEVQRLMHDVGIKVSMNYGCAASGGSSASGGAVPSTLKTYFGFGSANRASYSPSTVRDNIHTYHYPVLLEGCNDQTNAFLGIWYRYANCHEWVCDGTDETYISMCSDGQLHGYSYLSFHMNWGWHENNPFNNDYNGWFVFDNWNISGAGSGGSDLNFQYAQDMVTEIHP